MCVVLQVQYIRMFVQMCNLPFFRTLNHILHIKILCKIVQNCLLICPLLILISQLVKFHHCCLLSIQGHCLAVTLMGRSIQALSFYQYQSPCSLLPCKGHLSTRGPIKLTWIPSSVALSMDGHGLGSCFKSCKAYVLCLMASRRGNSGSILSMALCQLFKVSHTHCVRTYTCTL